MYQYSKIDIPCDLKEIAAPDCVLEILARRGFSYDDAYKFLHGTLSNIIASINSVDMDKAISLISAAREIVVYRDYDCDGICSSAIVHECLLPLGKIVHDYANERSVDGYGMCESGVVNIKKLYPNVDTILTVDNGIMSLAGVKAAKEAGLTVIVTDHHEQGNTLPDADAIIDWKCKRESSSFRELCGAGVAWKVMLALYKSTGHDTAPVLGTLDLVAVATSADVVPILSENRILLKEGLKMLNNSNRPFIKQLIEQLKLPVIDDHAIGYKIAPVLNSLSRMGLDTRLGVELLLEKEKTPFLVSETAHLVETNEQRKAVTEEGFEEARAHLFIGDAVLAEGNIPEGVVGIIAGRLKDEYHKPTIVFDLSGKGSARGVDGFNLKEALDRIPSGILTKYGGHAKAAGLTVEEGRLEEFKASFNEIVKRACLTSSGNINVELLLNNESFTQSLVSDLTLLEPYGEGFRPPIIEYDTNPTSYKLMGNENQHLKYISSNGTQIIKWNAAGEAISPFPTHFIGMPQINYWNGNISLQFICKDFF